MPPSTAASEACTFAVEFNAVQTAELSSPRSCGLGLPLPVLAGEPRELIFPEEGILHQQEGARFLSGENLHIGWAVDRIVDNRQLGAQTQTLYRRMLAAAKGQHLYRVWNYVPQINALSEGFENYRAFCQGRSLAFEEAGGEAFPSLLPAASAVGTDDSFLSLVFVYGAACPRHFENPEQIPAYRYPVEHGPRAPSFSRATVVEAGSRRLTFISGTSAIKGHATVARGAVLEQLECTIDNLRLVSRAAGAGLDLAAPTAKARHFKIYLRHAADLAATRSRLERDVLRPTDHVVYLRSDICRAGLALEIEATLVA